MFHRILVGVGGPQDGQDAVCLASRLAAPGADIVLVHVWDTAAGAHADAGDVEHPAQSAPGMLLDLQQENRLQAAPAAVVHGAVSPGAGLREQVDEVQPDLLVLGTSGGPVGHTGLSRDLQQALHGGGCALAVAPRGLAAAGVTLRRVGVAFAPKAAGEAAVDCARILAEQDGAALHAMTVIPPLPATAMTGPFATVALLTTNGGGARRRVARVLERHGAVAHVVDGMPAPALIAFSQEVDLLVLGARGHGAVRRLVLGSTTADVIRDASCPVLVVRRDHRRT